jgi:arylsulfatase A-like enzyme
LRARGGGGRLWLGDVVKAADTALEKRYHTEFGMEFDNGLEYADGRYDRLIRSVDIAPTLAQLLGISPSEKLDGAAVVEVIGGRAVGVTRP